jgi:hypothetical protein
MRLAVSLLTLVLSCGAGLAARADVLAADPATIVLRDDFDGTGFSPQGGLYYRENYEQSAGQLAFVPGIGREGGGALRLSVRALCPNDAGNCSERAEIWEKTGLRVPYNTGVWYGLSMRYDDPPPQLDHRYVVMQWKREIEPGAKGDFSPFLAMRLRSGLAFATVETDLRLPAADAPRPVAGLCPPGWSPVWLRPDVAQMRVLVAAGPGAAVLPAASADWHDYVFYTRPDPAGQGLIHILADGGHVVTVRGRIGHADPALGPNQYFKFGPYRAGNGADWTMFYDRFIRAPRCEAMLAASECERFE